MRLGEIIVVDGQPYEAVMADPNGACGDCPFLNVSCPPTDMALCWDGDTDYKFKALPLEPV